VNDRIATQGKEFDALADLAARFRSLPPVVDDDYPECRHRYEGALRAFLAACVANGRMPAAQATEDAGPTYEDFVREQWSRHRGTGDERDLLRQKFIMATGFAGECGEVVELLKKDVRDGKLDRTNLSLELGDALYYLTRIAIEHGFTLEEIQRRNRVKLLIRRGNGKGSITEATQVDAWRGLDRGA
jgi:NTP pyrophosphatase (non-canonical NTP hydrolase)